MRINNNLMANNTTRQMGINEGASAKSMEKLSSGYRINKAGDDAAGLAISEKMRGQIRGLNQASKNSQEGISLVQTAEGALGQTHDILQRMRELAVQGSTGTLTDEDRGQINKEFQELKKEVKDIADNTQFNKMSLLKGTFGNHVDLADAATTLDAVVGVVSIEGLGAAETYTFTDGGAGADLTVADAAGNSVTINGGGTNGGAQTIKVEQFGITITTGSSFVAGTLDGGAKITGTGSVDLQTGANQAEKLTVSIADMSDTGLGIAGSDTTTVANSMDAITELETAIKTVSDERAKLGATQNRLEYKIKNLDSSSENLTSAESQIRDVDMAKEMVQYTKNDILNQAAQAMLAKANQAPQGVLQLLR